MTIPRVLVLMAVALCTFAADVAGKLTGTAAGPQGSVAITEGKVSGDDVAFVENMSFRGMNIRIEYSGKIVGDELRLTRKVGEFATEELVAKRVK